MIMLLSSSMRDCDAVLAIVSFVIAEGKTSELRDAASKLAKELPKEAYQNFPTQNEWWNTDDAQGIIEAAFDLADEDAELRGMWFGRHPDDPACLGYWED